MRHASMCLDTDAPGRVSGILRTAAENYRQSATDLASAWQDPRAGELWIKIAKILDNAADRAEAACKRAGL